MIEYDGTPFVGWQMQDNGAAVQGSLADGGRGVLRRARRAAGGRAHRCRRACARPGRPCRSHPRLGSRHCARCAQRAPAAAPDRGAGDRDRGRRFRRALLGDEAPLSLSDRQPPRRPCARRQRAWRMPRPSTPMRCTSPRSRLFGRHDFTTFRAAECQANRRSRRWICSTSTARRRDPRARVGPLIPAPSGAVDGRFAGARRRGKWSVADLAQVLAARDRAACGPVAPPHGLYLVRVEY